MIYPYFLYQLGKKTIDADNDPLMLVLMNMSFVPIITQHFLSEVSSFELAGTRKEITLTTWAENFGSSVLDSSVDTVTIDPTPVGIAQGHLLYWRGSTDADSLLLGWDSSPVQYQPTGAVLDGGPFILTLNDLGILRLTGI